MFNLNSCQHKILCWIAILLLSVGCALAEEGETKNGGDTITNVLPVSSAYVVRVERPALPEKIQYEGREYSVDEGVQALMDVICDRQATLDRCKSALDTLKPVCRSLRGTPQIALLIETYDKIADSDTKAKLLACVHNTDDPRGLLLFVGILANENDDYLRALAGYALAKWNVRAGVALMIERLDSEAILGNGQPLAALMQSGLQVLNRWKGWGFPEAQILEEIGTLQGLDAEAKGRLYRNRWKQWFQDNRERFPEWKAGDPLPHIDAPAEQNGGAPPVLKDEELEDKHRLNGETKPPLQLRRGFAAQEFPNDTRTLMDSESGELFVIPTTELKPYPMPNPKTRKNTLYRTEICYWGEECCKRGSTQVIMNTLLGKPEPTHCPVCGHVVRFFNPRPHGRNPSDQAE